MRTIYYTGCTLDGFIATADHSLDWLTSRDIDPEGAMNFDAFSTQIGVAVCGATTYQWVLDNAGDWQGMPESWVFTHRDFAPADGIHFTQAPIAEVHAQMTAAAGGKDIWVMGGGELVGQFFDEGLLDEVWLQYAPVTLGAGAPVLPRHAELQLEETGRNRDFVVARHSVVK